MWTVAVIKDPAYYLRCVADRATAQELGLRRLAEATMVAYELADGTTLEASEVHALRRQVKVAGLRLADGREVALDLVEVLRDGRHVAGYRLADKTVVEKEDAQRVTLTRRRLAAYRLADGTTLAKGELRAITAGETLAGLTDAEGRPVEAAMVAIRDQMNGRILGYYSEHGEAPGQWIGKGALEDLGLTGLVSLDENRQAYERLMAGLHPVTGERLTHGQPGGERVSGFDHLVTVPKSVSLLWGLTTDQAVREAIEAAHKESITEALGWLESQISVARRGHASGGENDKHPDTIHHVPTTGVIGVRFQHRATRPGEGDPCGDPHLHTHVTIANLAHGQDGQWNALDAQLMYPHLRTASFVEQAAFRRLAVQKLAALGHHIEWTQPVNGHAEIKGLERRDWIEAFSRRSAEADAALERKELIEEVGSGPSKARDQAGHATRRAKETGLATSELVADWQARAAEIGLGPGQVEAALRRQATPEAEPELTPKLATQLAQDLTEQQNVFGLGDAIQAVANAARLGMTVARAVEMAKELTHGATDQIVALKQTARTVIRRDDGRVVKVRLNDEMAECFTTKEVIRLESQVITIAKERRLAGVGLARPEALAAALAAHPELGEDQVAMVTGLCTDGAGVAIALSPAGHGKTTALRPAAQAWQDSGFTVLATAQMAARAHDLGEGVGLDPKRAMTIAALRQRVEGTDDMPVGTPLPQGVVLLVDEVSVVDLRDLAALECHVRAADGKLVLVGDPQQLGSIGPGAPLVELPQVAPTYELVENRRQTATERDADGKEILGPDGKPIYWERSAIEGLRRGAWGLANPEEYQRWAAEKARGTGEDAPTASGLIGFALQDYDRHGRIVYAEGESRAAKADLIKQAAQDYLSAKDSGQSVALMAHTHKDRLSLNAVIRSELIQRGEVAADGMKAGDLEVAAGDTLQVLKNSRKLGLDNSDLVRVEGIDKEKKIASVRRPDGELVELNHGYLAKYAAHGYAETVNKAQGTTADVGLVLADSSSLSSQFGQVALTRGREDNRIYFAGPRPVDPEHHLPEEQAPSEDDQWKLIFAGLTRDRSKELASEVIAALDRDDRQAVEKALAASVEVTRAAAQVERDRLAAQAVKAEGEALARRDLQAIEAMQAEEAAKTSEEREAERRRADHEADEHRQQHQSHGMQRTRGPRP